MYIYIYVYVYTRSAIPCELEFSSYCKCAFNAFKILLVELINAIDTNINVVGLLFSWP